MCGARAPAAIRRGEPEHALANAAHVVRARYETAANNHHPLEPHVAVCWWEGDYAVVHTCTQAVFGTRSVVTHAFGLEPDGARVVSRLLGGGFGCKGALWFPWLLLTLRGSQAHRSSSPSGVDPARRCSPWWAAARRRCRTLRSAQTRTGGLPGIDHQGAGADLHPCGVRRSGRHGLAVGLSQCAQREHRPPARPHQRAPSHPDARPRRSPRELRA